MDKTLVKQVIFTLEKYNKDAFELVDELREFIRDNDCPSMLVDISRMNLIDSMKICIMSSTYHFAKYPEGIIEWQLANMQTFCYIRNLKLKNVKLSIKNVENQTIKYFERNYRMSIR